MEKYSITIYDIITQSSASEYYLYLNVSCTSASTLIKCSHAFGVYIANYTEHNFFEGLIILLAQRFRELHNFEFN